MMRSLAPSGRRTLMTFLRELMSDGKTRDVNTMWLELTKQADFVGDLPPRQSLSNRLYDLAAEGFLQRVSRGIYRLAPGASVVGYTSTVRPATTNLLGGFSTTNGSGPPLQAFPQGSSTRGGRPVS
jgi:hypothetical protein